ncbi:MAG: SMI1/KNR4 family protein [Verrucomicrobiales bacterium]
MGNPRARFDHQFASWLAAFKSRSENPEMMWMEGATAEEINQLEQAAGQIPPDLRRLLLTHNGQDQKATPLHFVNRLLSCEEIIHESTELQEINADVGLSPGEIDGTTPIEEAAWWHKNLLLFLSDDNGGGVAVDRQTGAVWDWDHDGGLFGQLAPDIGTFFEWMCLALKEGRYEKEEPIYYPELDPAKVESQETTAE